MKKVSVIIPVYNVEKYLKKCLDSVIKQDIDKEIILIDDGSVDNSYKIIQEYEKKYDYIKSFKQSNEGPGSARNLGIKKAKGKYICFVDSDDYLDKNALTKAYEIIESNDLDILYWNIFWITNGSKKQQRIFSRVYEKDDKIGYLLSDPSPCNKMFKRDLFKKNNLSFPTGIYYEDFAFIPSLIKYTDKIMYTNNISYNYVQHASSVMNQTKYSLKTMDLIDAYKYLYEELKPNYIDELEYLAINQLIYFRTFELLKYNKRKEIKVIINYISKIFPKWQNNKYYKKRSLFIRLYCYCIYHKLFILAYILYKIRSFIRK